MRWCPKNHYHLIHEFSFEMSSWSKLCTLHDPGDIHHLLSMIIQNVINDYLIDLSFSRTIAEMSDRINLPRNIVDRANNMFKVTVVTITIITMGKAWRVASTMMIMIIIIDIIIITTISRTHHHYHRHHQVVHDGKSLKGRSNDAIAAACLYIACRSISYLLFSRTSLLAFGR